MNQNSRQQSLRTKPASQDPGLTLSPLSRRKELRVTNEELIEIQSQDGHFNLQGRVVKNGSDLGVHLDQIITKKGEDLLRFSGVPQPSCSPFSTLYYAIDLKAGFRKISGICQTGNHDVALQLHNRIWDAFTEGGIEAARKAIAQI